MPQASSSAHAWFVLVLGRLLVLQQESKQAPDLLQAYRLHHRAVATSEAHKGQSVHFAPDNRAALTGQTHAGFLPGTV